MTTPHGHAAKGPTCHLVYNQLKMSAATVPKLVRLPFTIRYLKVLAPSQRQSTLAGGGLPIAGMRAVQPMATWTDRFRRWQSSTKKEDKENEGSSESANGTQSTETTDGKDADGESKVTADCEEVVTKQHAELKNKYLRALADAENMRQRMMKQVEEAKLFGIQQFSKDILDVADILEKATESVSKDELEGNKNPALLSLFEGLKMTESELQKVLTKNGLLKIDPLGEVFDPSFHEALFEIPGDNPGTVGVVTRVGYSLHGRTIRPARVGVVKVKETTTKSEK